MTIANAWFFMSALGTDLLWLRFYLFAAYVSLFIAGLTNYPPWGTWHRINGNLWILGGILWPFIVGESPSVNCCPYPLTYTSTSFRLADVLILPAAAGLGYLHDLCSAVLG